MAFYCTLAAEMSSVGEKSHKNVNFICLSSLLPFKAQLYYDSHTEIFSSRNGFALRVIVSEEISFLFAFAKKISRFLRQARFLLQTSEKRRKKHALAR